MSLLGAAIAKAAGKIAGTVSTISTNKTKAKMAITGDAVQKENNASNEQMQVLKQYASEFAGKQGIVEKFNKIVRPLFALTAWVVFGVRYLTPMIIFLTKENLSLADLMEIYNVLWVSDKWIIGGIITFYFGGRMQSKHNDNKNQNLLNEKISEILKNKPVEKTVITQAPVYFKKDSGPAPIKLEYDKTCSGRFSNPKTLNMAMILAKKCEADKIVIMGADRSRAVHMQLIKDKKTKSAYVSTQHGKFKEFKAADVKLFKNGKQLNTLEVGNTAKTIAVIGGIGIYKTFTHVDHRKRKPSGDCFTWGSWA